MITKYLEVNFTMSHGLNTDWFFTIPTMPLCLKISIPFYCIKNNPGIVRNFTMTEKMTMPKKLWGKFYHNYFIVVVNACLPFN